MNSDCMKISYAKVGKQIVDMAKANGVGRGSVFEFYWFGLEFKVFVTTRRDARKRKRNKGE